MYQQYRPASFNQLPVVVKNLLIINGLLFVAQIFFEKQFGNDILSDKLGLFFPLDNDFRFWQFFTYGFMHGDFWHLFFNMLGLWFFGHRLEHVWGPRRFLIFYMVCGLGAGMIHTGWTSAQVMKQTAPAREFLEQPELGAFEELANAYTFPGPDIHWVNSRIQDVRTLSMVGLPDKALEEAKLFCKQYLYDVYNTAGSIIGASGSVFGILMAFGLLFANTEIALWGLVPIRAKWIVLFFGLSEFIYAMASKPDDYIAHVAHLGGMVFGFILVKIYNRSRTHFF